MYTLIIMASLQKKKSRGHTYWQIVASRRVKGKPRPVVLMHLGTADKLLQRLQEGAGKPVTAKIIEAGALAALWNMAQELDLVDIINRHAPKREQGLTCGHYMLLAALNRSVHAASKASLYAWYRTTILARLVPVSKHDLASQRFWDHMGYLGQETIERIEEDITRRLVEQFHVNLGTLLFDATNFDTYIDTQTPCMLAQRGHAKSKRMDLRIIGLALLVSSDFHLPLFSNLYPGNQNDTVTFSQAIDQIVARYKIFSKECRDITIVYDGGNNSNENAEQIDQSPYHFVTSLTLTHHQDLLDVPLGRFQRLDGARLDGVWAYRTSKVVWGKERTVIITRSPTLLAGQVAGITASLRKKRRALTELRAKLHRSQRPQARGKGYSRESLQKRLDEIASGQYVSEILKAKIKPSRGKLDFVFRTDQAAFEHLKRVRLGKRILCTDNNHWTTEEIVLASRAQFHVENAFKQMKNPHWVSFSPTFHWTDQKLRVHAFYCLLALTLCALLQRKAYRAGIDLTIPAILEALSGIKQIVNLYASDTGDHRGRFRADITLSKQSSLQKRLGRLFGIYDLCRS